MRAKHGDGILVAESEGTGRGTMVEKREEGRETGDALRPEHLLTWYT